MTKGAATAAPDVVVVVDATSAVEVVRVAIARSIRRLARAEPIVRAGRDPEGVHRMRVGTRRLRSDLRSFEGVLDPAWAESLRRELRWLARALGGARETDVRRARIDRSLRSLPPAAAAAAEPFRASLGRESDAAADVLGATLGSGRYVALRARLEDAGRDPRPGPDADRPAWPILVPLVHRRFRALRREVAAAGEEPGDGTLHVIRIRAKRVRYAAEALASVGGEDVVRFAAAAQRMQDVLGAHQDAVATAGWLTTWADGRSGQAVSVDVAVRLATAERAAADDAERRWWSAWRRLRDPELRRWM